MLYVQRADRFRYAPMTLEIEHNLQADQRQDVASEDLGACLRCTFLAERCDFFHSSELLSCILINSCADQHARLGVRQ